MGGPRYRASFPFRRGVFERSAAREKPLPQSIGDCALSLRHASANLRRIQGRTEQRTDDPVQLLELRNLRMSGAPEHPPEVIDVGARADGETQAASAATARLSKRTACVGRAVDPLVAVVVRQ